MKHSQFKVLYYYQNSHLWKNITIAKLKKKKWNSFKPNKTLQYKIKGKYICHYKKLKVEHLYYYKFINKQILRKYLSNLNESKFKLILKKRYVNFEKRLDFNLYHANFVNSLYAAKFFITKGCVFVNKKCITSCTYLLQTNDLVEINSIFLNYIIKNINFSNFEMKTYLRNLEIDYKTFSFIFLNNVNYYIFNYKNFIKKIYLKQAATLNHNIFNYSNPIYSIRNKYTFNNFFNFFRHIYIYYLWIDKRNQYFKYKHLFYNQNYSLKILSRLLKRKYNNYYFRNILLKRIFNYKYNYLKILQQSNIFNNYSSFENITDILNLNLKFQDKTKIKNTLNNEFFKYIYTLIFQYYLYLRKNYYLNNCLLKDIYSSNSYFYYLIFNNRIFKLINIKNKLYNYFFLNYSREILNLSTKNKILNYKFIPYYKTQSCQYKRPIVYKKLICFILSKKYKYHILRKSHSFRQNKIKRISYIMRLKKNFNYTHFNNNKLGSNLKIITKTTLYHRFVHSTIKTVKKSYRTQIQHVYYPKYGKLYNNIYQFLIISAKINKQKLIAIRFKINRLQQQLTQFSDTAKLKKYLYNYELELTSRLNFLKFNKNQNNFNYNVIYKNIFLIFNLINYLINTSLINFNLNNLQTSLVYKMHFQVNLNQKKFQNKYTTKKYRRLAFYYRRFILNSYYLNFTKNKLIVASNLRKYFLNKLAFNNPNIKQFVNNYTHYYLKRRKYYFIPFYHYRFLNYKHNNLTLKFSRRYKKFSRIYYLTKKRKSKLATIKITTNSINQNIFYFMNLNLIDQNFHFHDNLFYIDLILNLYIRKLNTNYNKITYNKYSKSKTKFSNINRIYLKKTIIQQNNKLLKNSKFYYYFNYNYVDLYLMRKTALKYKRMNLKDFNYKNVFQGKNNKFCYLYNLNSQNYHLLSKLYKYSTIKPKNIYLFKNINKTSYITNLYKLYTYYSFNLKKYKIIKYIFTQYIFKEFNYFINQLLSNINIKLYNKYYIRQLYFNLFFSQLFNLDKYDYILKNNYLFSQNLKIIINYFIIIKRLYK